MAEWNRDGNKLLTKEIDAVSEATRNLPGIRQTLNQYDRYQNWLQEGKAKQRAYNEQKGGFHAFLNRVEGGTNRASQALNMPIELASDFFNVDPRAIRGLATIATVGKNIKFPTTISKLPVKRTIKGRSKYANENVVDTTAYQPHPIKANIPSPQAALEIRKRQFQAGGSKSTRDLQLTTDAAKTSTYKLTSPLLESIHPKYRMSEGLNPTTKALMQQRDQQTELAQQKYNEWQNYANTQKGLGIPLTRNESMGLSYSKRRLQDITASPIQASIFEFVGLLSEKGYGVQGTPGVPGGKPAKGSGDDQHHVTITSAEGYRMAQQTAMRLDLEFRDNTHKYLASLGIVPGWAKANMLDLPSKPHRYELHPWMRSMGFEKFWKSIDPDLAKQNPNKFYELIDEWHETIALPSMKAALKLAKDGKRKTIAINNKELILPTGYRKRMDQAAKSILDRAKEEYGYDLQIDTNRKSLYKNTLGNRSPRSLYINPKKTKLQWDDTAQAAFRQMKSGNLPEARWRKSNIQFTWAPKDLKGKGRGYIDVIKDTAGDDDYLSLKKQFFKEVDNLPSGTEWTLEADTAQKHKLYTRMFKNDPRITASDDDKLLKIRGVKHFILRVP